MNEENLNIIKATLTAVGAFFTAIFGTLAVPIYILVTLNVADYLTALSAAPYRGEERNSKKGIEGIKKKVCMWLLVGVGAMTDWLIVYASDTVGLEVQQHFAVGAVVAIWLICNEIISILENIGDIGVKLPPFLMGMVRWVQKTTEDKASVAGGKKDENIRN